MADPLTPAQVDAIQHLLADREADLRAYVQAQIETAIAPVRSQLSAVTQQVATLQEAVTVLDQAALKVGNPVALTGASGLVLGAYEGGPAKEGDPFPLVGRITVGEWESFVVQRGV